MNTPWYETKYPGLRFVSATKDGGPPIVNTHRNDLIGAIAATTAQIKILFGTNEVPLGNFGGEPFYGHYSDYVWDNVVKSYMV